MASGSARTRRQVIEGLIGLAAAGTIDAAGAGGGAAMAAEANRTPTAKPSKAGQGKSDPADRGRDGRGPGDSGAWRTLPPTPPLPAPASSGLVPVNGVEVFHATFGEGPAVLMLHGGMANSNWWGHQIATLAARHTVIVMDTRGHGRSPMTSPDITYPLIASDAAALLDALKVPKAAVVGWSDGAIAGFELAITRPGKVSALFSFGGNSSLDGMKPGGARSAVFSEYSKRCRGEYAALSPKPEKWGQLVGSLQKMWRTQAAFPKAKLAALNIPVTVCDGEHDEIIRREHTEAIAAAIPKARLVILPGVSHFAMVQDPAQFSAALGEFLQT